MAAPEGNQFWLARSSHGRNPIFENSEELRDACFQWFKWVEDNPLLEQKATQFQGVFIKDNVTKMRAMTIGGLCIFLDIARNTWNNYSNNEDFLTVTSEVEEIIANQKFTGAAADLLNANIIARDLGLKDASTSEVTATIEEKPLKERSLAELEKMLEEAKKKEKKN